MYNSETDSLVVPKSVNFTNIEPPQTCGRPNLKKDVLNFCTKTLIKHELIKFIEVGELNGLRVYFMGENESESLKIERWMENANKLKDVSELGTADVTVTEVFHNVAVETVGVQTIELQPVEVQTVEVQTVGVQTVGVQTVGVQKIGVQTVEVQMEKSTAKSTVLGVEIVEPWESISTVKNVETEYNFEQEYSKKSTFEDEILEAESVEMNIFEKEIPEDSVFEEATPPSPQTSESPSQTLTEVVDAMVESIVDEPTCLEQSPANTEQTPIFGPFIPEPMTHEQINHKPLTDEPVIHHIVVIQHPDKTIKNTSENQFSSPSLDLKNQNLVDYRASDSEKSGLSDSDAESAQGSNVDSNAGSNAGSNGGSNGGSNAGSNAGSNVDSDAGSNTDSNLVSNDDSLRNNEPDSDDETLDLTSDDDKVNFTQFSPYSEQFNVFDNEKELRKYAAENNKFLSKIKKKHKKQLKNKQTDKTYFGI